MPRNLMDLTVIASAAITGMSAIAVAIVSTKQHRTVRAVKEQVANSHTTNLRDDIDLVLGGIEGIRNDMRLEREDRQAGDAALARRLDRLEATRI